jgi:hypothetical protein
MYIYQLINEIKNDIIKNNMIRRKEKWKKEY